MITFFDTPFNSPILILLVTVYGIVASVTTFDTRLIQAKKNGLLTANESILPNWVGIFYWFEWLVFIAMFLLNWKFALIAIVVKFILKVLPVLEIIGNILMSPFKGKN